MLDPQPAQKRGRGRPRTRPPGTLKAPQKGINVNFWIEEPEHNMLKEVSKATRISVSALIKACLAKSLLDIAKQATTPPETK